MRQQLLTLLLILLCQIVLAQERKIEGIVKGSDGITLPGVNIVGVGTSRGGVTDADGKFSIQIDSKVRQLAFSMIGYNKLTLTLGPKNYYAIELATSPATQLDEVVVVGYNTQKRINLTGSVGVIDGSAITAKPITSASQALAGKIAGVHVAQSNGLAGSDGAQISIRGIGSLGNTAPLILIDGVISPSIDVINPNDIQSISVLKDAASASIYGSQAANGVILVTTKKGAKDSKPVLNFESSVAISEITPNSKPRMITDPVLYMTLLNEARQNSAGAPVFTEEQIERYATPAFRDKVSTDWFDQLVGKGKISQHDLSVRGGTQNTQYFMSLGYLNQESILPDGNFRRITGRMNLESQVLRNVRIGSNLGYTYSRTRTPNGSVNDFSLLNILRGTPLSPAYTDDGYLAVPDQSTLPSGGYQGGNPLAEFSANDIRSLSNNITGRVFLDWEPLKNLKVSGNFTSSFDIGDYNSWTGRPEVRNWRYSELVAAGNTSANTNVSFFGFGRLSLQASKRYRINPYAQATYHIDIKNHNIDLLAGVSSEINTYDWFSTSRGNYLSNYVRVLSAGDPATMQNSSGNTKNAFISQFGRLNYVFRDKYLFEANIRRDGSSRFGPNYRYGVFPSFSAGWVMTNEMFMKRLPVINFLKLRGSWGKLGNQGSSDDFPYISRISFTDANYVWGNTVATGARADSYGNADVHWETSTMTNLGANVHLLNSMLQLEVDYFNKLSKDILFYTPLPYETGFNGVVSNLASVRNKGIETNLTFTKKIGGIRLDLGFNAARVRNEVISLNPELSDASDRVISGEKILQRGLPINSFYLVKWTGRIFQTQNEVNNTPHQPNAAPGDLIFEDVSGPNGTPDGKIDANDRVPSGTQYPTWTFGGNASVSYKGFTLSADFQGIRDAYAYGAFEYFYPTFQGSNIAMHWIDRWTPEHPSLTKPRLWNEEGPNTELKNTYFLMDRSYLRLRNLLISYQVPAQVFRNLSVSGLRLYLSGSNLLTWTKYPGFDPEITRDANTRGGLPQVRMFKAGLMITL